MEQRDSKPWYKQAWPWFVFSLPLTAVIAGIITYFIAAEKPHSMVQDDYFKKGLGINQSIAKLEEARHLKLIATLEFDTNSDLMLVRLDGESTNATQLKVSFSHPTKETFDQVVTLEPLTNNQFVAQQPKLRAAYWHIRVTGSDRRWLLKGRWQYPESQSLVIDANR